MTMQKIISSLRFNDECQKMGIPLWQCPHFLFLIMGISIIGAVLSAYLIGSRIVEDPYMINLIILGLTALLIAVSFIITRSVERLAEANRLKSEFVGIVSHQLRAPLTNFVWALDFLKEQAKQSRSSEQDSYFNILTANAGRMQELVNDLLMVSRIQEGKVPLYKKQFSFPELVSSIAEEFRPVAQASNIEVRVEGDEAVGTIENDAEKVSNVMANLLDNAIKYTKNAVEESSEPRKGFVALRYKRQKNEVCFEVEDNGIGIPRGDEKFIFERFFRSSNVLKHETHGTGLGLYIAKSIIEKAGGSMGFRSEEGKGSTFWFTLPAK